MIEGQGDTQIEAVEKQEEKQLATLNGFDLYVNKKKIFYFVKQKEIFNDLYNKRFD